MSEYNDKSGRAAYDPYMYSTLQGGDESKYMCNPGLADGENMDNTANVQTVLKMDEYWRIRLDPHKNKYANTNEMLIACSLV